MDDRRFDHEPDELEALLADSLSAPPPEDVLRTITPWRKAMNRILTGLVLGAITLNFWKLDLLLPAAGHLLLLLGLRTLRRENRAFRVWWYAFLVQTGLWAFSLLHKAAPGWQDFDRTTLGMVLTGTALTLELLQFLCLWLGLRRVRQSAGLAPGAGSALALLGFNGLLLGLVAVGFTQIGWLFFILLVIVYICIIRGLYKLSKELDEAGYIVRPAPVHIPDWPLVLGLAGALLAGIAAVSLICNRLPMDWQPVDPAEHSQTAELEAELLELGFPEYVLADLAPDDIQSCAHPLRVVVDEYAYALTNTWDDETPKPLTITGVAVELAGEREKWRLFHYFSWDSGTRFYGTEAIQFWPTDHLNEGWTRSSPATGRVLYDRDGIALWSPYHFLGEETFTSNSLFWGAQTSTDLFASFSFPPRGDRCRGYVTYEAAELQDGWIIDSWCNYAHARKVFQYPALTALDWVQTRAISSDDEPFSFNWDAIQFYPWTVDEEGVF